MLLGQLMKSSLTPKWRFKWNESVATKLDDAWVSKKKKGKDTDSEERNRKCKLNGINK